MKRASIILVLAFALVNCVNNYAKRFPLHSAVSLGNVSKVETLIKSGTPIEKRDESGLTPLMTAIYSNQWETIKALIDMRADVNAKDPSGTTPLLYAVYGNQPKTVSLLADHGANIEAHGSDGLTPLMLAASYRYFDIVKILAEKGAKINVQDSYGMTPLLYAVSSCQPDAVGFLIKRGAQVNVKDKNGLSAIHQLVLNCSESPMKASAIINNLLENGCDIAAVDKDGHSAFRTAMEYRFTDMVALLRKNGVVERFNRFEEGTYNHFDESLRDASFFNPPPGAYIIPPGKEDLYRLAVEDCNHLVVEYKGGKLTTFGPIGYGISVLVDKYKVPAKHQICMEKMGFQRNPAIPLEH